MNIKAKNNDLFADSGKKRKRGASLDVKKARAGWLFVLPFVIGFVLLYLPIIFDSIKYSFHEIRVLATGGVRLEFVGWDNYKYALMTDPKYVQTLIGGIKQLIIDIPAIVIFSLFVAILLNGKIAGRAAFRAIFFIPVLLTTGLIADIDAQNTLMDYMEDSSGIDTGEGTSTVSEIVSVMDVQALFSSMAVGTELVEYVVGLVNNIFNIINRSGVQMLIFLSGLQSISPAIYESCSIDGASSWETFWKITLPMVSPMILVNTIYTVIDSFTSSSNTVMQYISIVASSGGKQEVVGSAMSWMYFLIVMLIIALVAAILSAFIFYQRKD